MFNMLIEKPGDNESQSSAPGDTSRRDFLYKSAAATGVIAGLSLIPGTALAGGITGKKASQDVFESIQIHENDHVAFLVQALGGAARPKPTFQNLQFSKKDYKEFLALARTFENTGVSAYLGAAPNIMSSGYLAAAASIATVEARHAGVLNVYSDTPVTIDDASFDAPLTADEIVSAVSPFIASLNGGAPPSYSTTKSSQNDIDILNFALALEYLEAEFYNLNVPVFYKSKNKVK